MSIDDQQSPSAPGWRVALGLSALAFVSMLSYALARPSIESLFLEVHGQEGLPAAWLLVAGLIVPVIMIYVRLVSTVDLLRLYLWTALVSAALFAAITPACQASVPGAHFALYAVKEIYVVVLIEVFYSFANAVFPIQRARWFYGLFGGVGAVGGIIGNLGVGPLASALGTGNVPWLLPPLLLLLAGLALLVARGHPLSPPPVERPATLRDAGRVVGASSYLLAVTLLIVVTQLVITFVDFSYNGIMKEAFPDTDLRAGMIGRVYAGVAVCTFTLHTLTGPVLRAISVPGALLAIPLLLSAGLGVFVLVPGLATVLVVKVASKAFDYTIFKSAKEILYIPLSYAEKTQGKSIVDMLSYRVAKGAASLLLLGLIATSASSLVPLLTLALMAVWIGLTVVIARRFRGLVSRAQEMTASDAPGENKTDARVEEER